MLKTILGVFFLIIEVTITIIACIIMSILIPLSYLFSKKINDWAIHFTSWIWCIGLIYINPFWRYSVKGLEHLDKNKTYLMISNHQSLLDIPMIYALLNYHFKWVSKKEIYKMPFYGWALWFRKDVAIDRKDRYAMINMLKGCEKYLNESRSVCIFPEGTRSTDGKTLLPFKEGAFRLAKKCTQDIEILPIVINGTSSAMQKGTIKLNIRQRFTLEILPPIPIEVIKEKTHTELKDICFEQITAKFTEINR